MSANASPTREARFWGIELKLVFLLIFVSFFLFLAGSVSFFGLREIEQSSLTVTERETPLVRGIEEALTSLIVADNAAERALDIDNPSDIGQIDALTQTFDESNARFRMFVSAITWGSESDAFKRSDDGANYKAWINAGLADTFVVQPSSSDQTQLAGQTDVYYDGFINNVEKALEERKTYLELLRTGGSGATTAKTASKDDQMKARRFIELTAENLRAMVALSNQTTATSAAALTETERRARLYILASSVTGFLLALFVSIIFARRVIMRPIQELTKVAEAFGGGAFEKRVEIKSHDEFALLGTSFNTMAERLERYTKDLERIVSERTGELNLKVKELALANERLLELDKAKSEFISVAAHQLRTPLSALKWIFGLLLEESEQNPLTADQKSSLLKGSESNERMIRLINEMLVVTRIESGKTEYAFAPTHIEDIIESVLLDFSTQAHARNIPLVFPKPTNTLPYINADPEKMRAVLQNLIENAMKYTNDGGSITVEARLKDGFIQVSVKDTGIGIPERQQSSIFNKFFRADNAVKLQTDGSGLGLYIAKIIIEKHGGKIWFESALGKGTTFFFTIPPMKG